MTSLQSGNYPIFTNPQKLELEAIAATCGLEGGFGVYWARSLLRKSIGFYNDDVLCLPPPTPLSSGSTEATELTIYPNPVENILNIELPITNDRVDFSIHNSLGVCISNGILNNNSINVSALQSGLYVLSLSTHHEKISTTKFIKK